MDKQLLHLKRSSALLPLLLLIIPMYSFQDIEDLPTNDDKKEESKQLALAQLLFQHNQKKEKYFYWEKSRA